MTTQHFSKYTERMDDGLAVVDIDNFDHINFQVYADNKILQQLYTKRNGRNGNQYRIVDIFNENLFLFNALLFGGTVFHVDGNFVVNMKITKVNAKHIAWIFPKGFPQNEKQMNSWLSYVGWVANRKFA